MTSRRRGRQFAVQMLYQHSFSAYEPEKVFDLFWRGVKTDDATREFAETLVLGVLRVQSELDMEITAYLKNWTLERIAVMDHLVLQLGFYELIHEDDIPWKVVIDEAVSLAKMYSTEKSATFINGVLHAWATKNNLTDMTAEEAMSMRATDYPEDDDYDDHDDRDDEDEA